MRQDSRKTCGKFEKQWFVDENRTYCSSSSWQNACLNSSVILHKCASHISCMDNCATQIIFNFMTKWCKNVCSFRKGTLLMSHMCWWWLFRNFIDDEAATSKTSSFSNIKIQTCAAMLVRSLRLVLSCVVCSCKYLLRHWSISSSIM